MVKKTSSLVDQHGRPIEYEVLDREIAAPTFGGIRSVVSGHPAQGLDPHRLASILRGAENGDATAYFELAEEIEEKYLHYQAQLGTRKRAVTQLEITVEAASDAPEHQKHADLIRDWLNRDELEGETFDILDAVGKSVSYTEMIWDTSKPVWLPRLKTRDQRWFEFDQIDGETPLLRGGTDGNAGLAQPLPPHKFIVHRHVAKTGLTIRGGLARGVAWPYLFQNFALKDWVVFAEVYGMPIRVGKFDASATEEDRRKLLRAVLNIATDTGAIIPKSMEMEIVNGMASANVDVYKELCQYLDQQVSKAVVGQTATADAVAGGLGGSQGTVHNDVRQDIQRADAKALASTLNTQLVRAIIDFNFGPQEKYPRIKIGNAEFLSLDDIKKIEAYVEMGGEVEASVIGDKLGLPDAPKKGAKLLTPRSKSAPQPAPIDDDQKSGPSARKAPPAPVDAPEAASMARRPFLNPLKTALNPEREARIAAAASKPAESDAIDDAIEGMAGGWVEVEDKLLDPIFETLESASTADEFKSRLIGALEAMDATALTEQLTRSLFMARLSGEAGLSINPEGT